MLNPLFASHRGSPWLWVKAQINGKAKWQYQRGHYSSVSVSTVTSAVSLLSNRLQHHGTVHLPAFELHSYPNQEGTSYILQKLHSSFKKVRFKLGRKTPTPQYL